MSIRESVLNGLWRGLSTMEIMDELRDSRGLNLTLGDAEEREVEGHIIRLRKELAEAHSCAQAAAEEAFRQGKSWQETLAILDRPRLLPQDEIVAFATKAYNVVFKVAEQQQLVDFDVVQARLREQAIAAAAAIDPSLQEGLDEIRRDIAEHEQRLESQRIESRQS